jgi:flagellar biosynthesis protein FlhA
MSNFDIRSWLGGLRATNMSAPVLIVLLLAMIVLPLPGLALDVLFTFNIALSIMVLLIALQTTKPLDFLSFPNILLMTTILRLSLNVASTRLVLTQGHTGSAAAGNVIESFGHFLIGGNFAVGIVVFVILTIINFIVVTKGAGRIAEVGARFTLDALPGKQMAIDAELNAGHISQEQARKRRIEVGQEADFYGAMDGASKYVRGDAIAGMLVILVNIIGGLIVGVVQHDLAFSAAAKNYTLLAIGDGLVAQIPSIIISIAAGVVVSRVSNDQDIGTQLTAQLFSNHKVLGTTAVIIGIMGIIPGMPHFAFLTLALLLCGLALLAKVASQRKQEEQDVQEQPNLSIESEVTWQDVKVIEVLSLELGRKLTLLVAEAQASNLLKRIRALRKLFADEVGFLTPSVHIVDNVDLSPNAYAFKIKGVVVARGTVYPDRLFALDPGTVTGPLKGDQVIDPAFGLPAYWIEPIEQEEARNLGYTIVDPSTVIATHLNQIMQSHADAFMGRSEVYQLLDIVLADVPKLKEEFIPKSVSLFTFQKVLQNLLSEGLPIRDLHTIIDTLCEHGPQISNSDELTEKVRHRLGLAIIQHVASVDEEIRVITLEEQLEKLLSTSIQSTHGSAFEPGLAETLLNLTKQASQKQIDQGITPVLVVSSILRLSLARFLKRHVPHLYVLSHDELRDSKGIRVTSVIGREINLIPS